MVGQVVSLGGGGGGPVWPPHGEVVQGTNACTNVVQQQALLRINFSKSFA
jgi:hypothetical protein